MGNLRKFLALILATAPLAIMIAQDIPMGTWRSHISYRTIVSLDITDTRIFAAAPGGLMMLDRTDQSFVTYDKVNGGLSNVGITAVRYDTPRQQLVVSYDNGTFDLIRNNEVRAFDPTANAQITGSKKINDVMLHGSLAYLSTDYGIVVVDLAQGEVKETWRDLGPNGNTLKISRAIMKGDDSIFVATEKGIIAGDIEDNLLDYNAWKRFNSGAFNTTIDVITFFNDRVYTAVDGTGIFRYENGIWNQENFLPSLVYTSLQSSSAHLFVTENSNVWRIDGSNEILQIVDDNIVKPMVVMEESSGTLWIGDSEKGLISNEEVTFKAYLPNGPSTNDPFRLKYAFGKIYLMPGGYSSTFQPLRNQGILNTFVSGRWEQSMSSMPDLTDIAVTNAGEIFLSSFGFGVEKISTDGSTTIFNEDNSTLLSSTGAEDFVTISAIENSRKGIWVANYAASASLHLKNNDNTWQNFSFATAAARYPLDLVVDYTDKVWMMLNPSQGGGIMVYDPVDNIETYLNDADGSGELPSKLVRSMAVDRDGMVWVGTDLGVCYFFTSEEDAIRPIFENRFLLRDDRVTAIAVDGGNRKWMGTERGVWLFDPTGEKLIYNFTTANSPLLSDIIRDIEINGESGEVFIATARGLVSFRSDATDSKSLFSSVKIFPNPVLSTFTGTVGISGLATDAAVKITDVSGKLIWETKANGGTATWNVRDYNGRRASTGVYIIFCATADGAEHAVGKIAVVN